MNTEAVGCIRVSTSAQQDRYGPARQREEIEALAAREGLSIVQWIEDTVSGADHSRASENEYYALARRHHGLHFIFSHPNRVGRHVEVTVGIARQIHRLGGTVHVAGIGNLRDRRNWVYFLRDASSSEEEYQNIVDQLVRGKIAKAREHGKWPHGAPPWGYRLERDHRGRSTLPVPVPELAAAVRRAFELSEELGQGRAAQIMAEEGWPGPAGFWSLRTVGNIIGNRRYTGEAVFRGVSIFYEPIIPVEQFERVQARRQARAAERPPRPGRHVLLFTGHARCAVCGRAVGRQAISSTARSHAYYVCHVGRKRAAGTGPGITCSNRAYWNSEAVEESWWAFVVAQLSAPELLPQILPPETPVAVSPPPARLAELEGSIRRAWEPFAAGHITQEMAAQLAAPYQEELTRLRQEYAPKASPAAPDYAALAEGFREALAGCHSFEERRALMGVLELRLFVGPDGPERIQVAAV